MNIRQKYLFLMATILWTLIGCSQTEELNKTNDYSERSESFITRTNTQSSLAGTSDTQEDSRLARLASLSFSDALHEDWGFTIAIVPITVNGEPNLGDIVRRRGNWAAGYGSGFAGMEVVSIEEIEPHMMRFWIDIWKNEDTERPFALRQPDTPTYRFYFDLSESEFREVVSTGIIENRRVTGTYLPAFDTAGKPVDQWWLYLGEN